MSDDAPKDDEKKEEMQSTAAEPEKAEEKPVQVETKAKRPKAANPYGVWEQILQEEDP